MPRLGCLIFLVVLALLGACVYYFGNAPPDRDEGPERLAYIVGFLLVLYIVVVGAFEAVRAIRARQQAEPRG